MTTFDPEKDIVHPSCVLFQIWTQDEDQVLVIKVFGTTLEAGARILSAPMSREHAMRYYEQLEQREGYKQQPATLDHSSRTQSLAHPDSVIGRLHPLGVLLPRQDIP